jgi:hypothetical protein
MTDIQTAKQCKRSTAFEVDGTTSSVAHDGLDDAPFVSRNNSSFWR